MVLLKLALPRGSGLQLSEQGRRFASADILRAKEQFATLVVEHAPLVRGIVKQLRRSDNGAVRAETILDDLRDTFGDASARTQFDRAVDWGRYSELLEYDVGTDRIELA